MKLNNIFDIYTGLSYEEVLDEEFETINRYGVYVGCLMESDAQAINTLTNKLYVKCIQLHRLNEEIASLENQIKEFNQYILHFLEVSNRDKINIDDIDFNVSDEGHTWLEYHDTKND